jgi:hypothetical protein
MDEQVTREPVLLQRIDYDRDGHLVLILNQHVTNEWVRVFYGISTIAFFPGKEPRNFSFKGNRASIPYANEGQQLIDYFKEYLTLANTLYHQRHEATRLKAEAAEQHQRQQDRDWHEHRDRIVNDLRP